MTHDRLQGRDVRGGAPEAIGDVLEIKGELPFKIAAYRKAASNIEGLREPIEQVRVEGRLRKIPGVGAALEQKISEFLDTGRLGYYDKLVAEFPPGLVALLDVPGLGPRKARLVFETLWAMLLHRGSC